jgi:hypothetical protein
MPVEYGEQLGKLKVSGVWVPLACEDRKKRWCSRKNYSNALDFG